MKPPAQDSSPVAADRPDDVTVLRIEQLQPPYVHRGAAAAALADAIATTGAQLAQAAPRGALAAYRAALDALTRPGNGNRDV